MKEAAADLFFEEIRPVILEDSQPGRPGDQKTEAVRYHKPMYWLAGALSVAGLMAHEALGAPLVLPPLVTAELPSEVLWLHRFSWHVDSVAVAAMAVMFIYAALKPRNMPMALVAIGMSAGFAALGIALAVFGSDVMWGTPAPYAWSLIAVVGGVAVLLEWRGDPTGVTARRGRPSVPGSVQDHE